MKLDFRNCKTPEDVERVTKPLCEVVQAVRSAAAKAGITLNPGFAQEHPAAARAYVDGRLHGMLIIAVRKARVAWACGDVTLMTEALAAVSAAECAAGVDLTTPTDEDLRAVPPPPRSVRCPTCEAQPDDSCRTELGKATRPHKARRNGKRR